MTIKNIQKITNRRSKMRLIDADKLRKQIHCEYSDDLGILEKIDKQPTAYDIQYVEIVQARKHRKKRTNKKCLKRYGYKKVIVNSKGWHVKTYTDGTVEFVK